MKAIDSMSRSDPARSLLPTSLPTSQESDGRSRFIPPCSHFTTRLEGLVVIPFPLVTGNLLHQTVLKNPLRKNIP